MIRSRSTEYVRVVLPAVQRDGAELGRLLVAAIENMKAIDRQKARVIEEFVDRQKAAAREVEALISEVNGPVERHEDVCCQVWYDLDLGERFLVSVPDDKERGRRPMTGEDWAEAERLKREAS